MRGLAECKTYDTILDKSIVRSIDNIQHILEVVSITAIVLDFQYIN